MYLFTNKTNSKTCVIAANNLSAAKKKFNNSNKAKEIFNYNISKTILIQ